MSQKSLSDEDLFKLQHDTFSYFLNETNLNNGLVPDSTRPGAPSSIAATGLALAAYPVGVERKLVSRADAAQRVLTTLRFFWNSPQSTEPHATGYKGFYYHFLEMESGQRAMNCELSTIDSTILIGGALVAACYFDQANDQEQEIRTLADKLYRRVEWPWMVSDSGKVLMAWQPELGFQPWTWEGYNESILLHVLALGSPTHPLPEQTYQAFTSTYVWREIYGRELLYNDYSAPLFIHQLSHLWIDFRGIQDEFMREKGIDYFENSRRATYTQRDYAVRNPNQFRGYGEFCWGITASDGPGPARLIIDGIERNFFAYEARGVPFGPDDGTLAPWSVVASLPFAPELVLPTLQYFNDAYPEMTSEYGLKCSFNPTFQNGDTTEKGWISRGYYGLDQGPVVVMIENFFTELIWNLMKKSPYVINGLRRAGFSGGWL
jgi:hypothetical protein